MERIPAVDTACRQLRDWKNRPAFVWSYRTPSHKSYPFRVLEWISQGFNVLTGGHQDLTFSQRAGAWAYHGKREWPAKFIDAIMGKNHCRRAWEKKV